MTRLERIALVAGLVTGGWAIVEFGIVVWQGRRMGQRLAVRHSLASLVSTGGSVTLRWLRRRMTVAYGLCLIATAVIVVVGHRHRVAAAVLLFTAFVATHIYVLLCALWALVLAPPTRPGVTGPFWDDTPLAGLLALPVFVALGRFTDESTGAAGIATVGIVLLVMFVRGYRNDFTPPEARAGPGRQQRNAPMTPGTERTDGQRGDPGSGPSATGNSRSTSSVATTPTSPRGRRPRLHHHRSHQGGPCPRPLPVGAQSL